MQINTSLYTKNELELTNKLNKFYSDNGYTIKYYVGTSFYTIEHLLPLYFAHPGELIYSIDTRPCGATRNCTETVNYIKNTLSLDIVEKKEKDILNWLKDDKHILIFVCDVTPFVYITGTNIKRSNCITVSHGIDEDVFWHPACKGGKIPNYASVDTKKNPYAGDWYSLVYSKINEKIIPKQYTEHIKKFYEIDPNKKTILYISSMLFNDKYKTSNKYNGYEFLIFNETKERVIDDLIKLKKTYNVIVRLHPCSNLDKNKKLLDHFKINTIFNFDYPYFLPFVKLADIVIGPPNGVFVAACYYKSKKLISLNPIYSKTVSNKVMGKNKDFLLNDENCIMVYPENPNLIEAVKLANENHTLLAEKRNKYVNFKLRGINGYENYKNHIKIAKKFLKLDIPEEFDKIILEDFDKI